ncbi:hydroxyethylthiazole kinase [uncultured Intestinimonas sp.]|uniref:hydroxyethylthiazole kinase n=1 Tax=uncultured Intestinimonas sp. TaxID=1689265 RepID=UPI0025E84002|nr:hydroxyethylthiazole kinase [uncultured Intestinimonas sp.]
MDGAVVEAVRQSAPLIHCITNYVTANDVANLLLAIGARPVMADDPAEAAEITLAARGLCLNLGTLHSSSVPAMYAAGAAAAAKGIPLVLDPVGAGSSTFRTQTARDLTRALRPAVLRCNPTELAALAGREGGGAGVDAAPADRITEANLTDSAPRIAAQARELGAVVAVTGAVDLVTDGTVCYAVRNGRPEMGRVTGTGCQLSALLTAFLSVRPDRPLEAALGAVCAMGLAGELAWGRMAPGDGNAAYRGRIIDAIYHLSGQALEKGARYEAIPL